MVQRRLELERATTAPDRLYQAVEEGALSIDDTLRTRTQKLKARRSEVLTETAKLKDRQALAVRRVNADTVKSFCTALKERFTDPTSGLGKAYLRLLVDEIRLDGNQLVVTGSHGRLSDAVGFMEKRKLGEVPSFVYLPGISCPVMAIQGRDDQYGSMAQLQAIALKVKGPCGLVKLEQCGHSPFRDQSDKTLAALTRFVGGLAVS